MQNWLQVFSHFGLVLASQIVKDRFPERYKSVSIFQSISCLHFVRLRVHQHLLALKTSDVSREIALLLRLPIFFDLETYVRYDVPCLLSITLNTITNTSQAVIVTLLKHRGFILVFSVTI